MKFLALDVETANAELSSICALGMALFENGEILREWYTLVNPLTFFDGMNVSIHGIQPEDVEDAPTFAELAANLWEILAPNIVVTHTHFDKASIHQAAEVNGVSIPSISWLDSARVARRTWPECARSGYGLAPLCRKIGYEFRHHHALEDAKAAGQILLSASRCTGIGIAEWLERVELPITPRKRERKSIVRDGHIDGPLAGEVVVFTGSLSMTREEAADLAALAGCEVDSNVTRKTTLLIVGELDITRMGGHERSRKWRKAEELISEGQEIRVLGEHDFRKIMRRARIKI
jgi:DNA polymerase-3 subunit epsilon